MSLTAPWTSTQLGSELSIGAAFTSAQVGTAIGTGGAFTSAQAGSFTAGGGYTAPSAVASQPTIKALASQASGSKLLTTASVTAVVSNGQAPFSYDWYIDSGAAVSIGSPNSVSTSVSATVAVGNTVTGNLKCQITDSKGSICWTGDVAYTLTCENNS